MPFSLKFFFGFFFPLKLNKENFEQRPKTMPVSRTWKFCETEIAVISMNVQINVAKNNQEL